MRLHPDDDQRLLADSVARFARAQAGAAPGTAEAGLAELGLLALALPEQAGGLSGRGGDLMVMMEALGRALLPTALPLRIGALDLLGRAGSVAQHDRWVTPGIEGRKRLALVPLEAGTLAEGRLQAPAILSPGAAGASALVVALAGRACVVEAGTPGLSLDPLTLADGSTAAHLRLDGVMAEPIPATADQIADSLARARLAAAAQMLGIMERLLADTLDHVKTRRQFGVAIGSFQTVQHRMARLQVGVGQCRSAVMAAALGETGARSGWLRRVAAAAALVGDRALHLAHECVQFHGGMGITADLPVSLGHRQVMVLSRQFGGPAAARRDFDRLSRDEAGPELLPGETRSGPDAACRPAGRHDGAAI